jgi:hypothetical protein
MLVVPKLPFCRKILYYNRITEANNTTSCTFCPYAALGLFNRVNMIILGQLTPENLRTATEVINTRNTEN